MGINTHIKTTNTLVRFPQGISRRQVRTWSKSQCTLVRFTQDLPGDEREQGSNKKFTIFKIIFYNWQFANHSSLKIYKNIFVVLKKIFQAF
ncbi:MAG: hypothetical protein A2275_09285 [Bacteroidetes bacterium RIFOXYA12_FULL_35_11]|nr:MAG: hypothetical protein A2X01_13115 [Bacteroidetes bacterium GWF2_35_48]OFY78091.1 MAG: hypothetical protein A2275_09285 [Bacteroidetes bacterium RIFOXYA12_FULL_35_11]OFY95855.1 MAG: hypothetical protein A2491_01200 [Bacteroidetes bacterium RIFOXYC12_FULL_35_7]HBX53729.1 hypothetical protein [Bacteroidales bacterium]